MNTRHITDCIHPWIVFGLLALGACGGGGGSPAPPTPTPAPTYTIGGSVSGLVGSGLALQLNGANSLSISANGNFAFAAALVSGTNYTVSVSAQPSAPTQTCAATGASGTIAAANVTGVAVTCVIPAPAAAPTLSITGSLKALNFSWTTVPGATFYRLSEDADGVSGYSQIGGDQTGTAFSRSVSVHRTNWAQAKYVIAACNSGGCGPASALVTINANMLPAIGYLKASNSDASDGFGRVVAISSDGNTLAIAAVAEDGNAIGVNGNQNDNSVTSTGAVYIFNRSGNTWIQEAYVKASNPELGDFFGTAVALSADGNTLAVSALSEDSNAVGINGDQTNNTLFGAGAVYVFSRVGSIWTQQAYVKASNTNSNDNFGTEVALSYDGNTMAVGAPLEDSAATGINGNQNDNTANFAGAAYVFTRAGSTWTQQAYVKASNTQAGDRFGDSLALSGDGNSLVVAAPSEQSNATGVSGLQTDNSLVDAGAVYVFTRTGTNWAQQAYVKASNTSASDNFGTSVSLSSDGNLLAVGANGEDSNATGISVIQTDDTATNAGAVYVFLRSGAVWNQQAYIKAGNTDVNDLFGGEVALSGDGGTLIVAADNEQSSATGINGNHADNSSALSGAAYVFTRSGAVWTQQSYIKAPNTNPSDNFGAGIAVSFDGSTLAIGADGEDSDSNGVNGSQNDEAAPNSGAIYLY